MLFSQRQTTCEHWIQ